jgi:glycerophosphoryl diester phosphodiesterase
MLIELTNNNKMIKPSRLYEEARKLDFLVYAWTFRKDDVPKYANSFDQLLNIFSKTVQLDGIITDHPAEAIVYYQTQKSSFIRVEFMLIILSVIVSFILSS